MANYRSLEWRGDSVRMLDQRRLPHETVYIDLVDYTAIADAIRTHGHSWRAGHWCGRCLCDGADCSAQRSA